jgi:hypothetical protein
MTHSGPHRFIANTTLLCALAAALGALAACDDTARDD